MNDWLLTLLRMSAAGALTILGVLLARLALRRFPRKYVCLLWLAVLFRLRCPVTLPSPTSVVPEKVESGELVTSWTESYAEETKVIRRGEPGYKAALDAGRTPVYGYPPTEQSGKGEAPSDTVGNEGTPSEPVSSGASAHSYVVTAADGVSEPKKAGEVWLPALVWIWLGGAAALMAWSVFKYLRLRFRLREAVKLEKGVYEAEGLDSPFVLGVLRPRIYLPWSMAEDKRSWVLLHERAHIRRLDPLWKLLGWLALCLHWFNPLCWLAFFLAVRDMEGACDEAVIRGLDGEERAVYSDLLLSLSAGRPLFAATPLGFGEGNVKQRIKSVLQWRKPKRWMVILAVLLLAAVVLLFAFGPRSLHRDFQSFEDTPDVWPQLSFFKQKWTEVCAGQRGIWPVKDVKGLKKELTKLLEEGSWKVSSVIDNVGEDDSFWKRIYPGKLRWVSGGKTWELYLGERFIVLVSGDFETDHLMWVGSAVGEDGVTDEARMKAILALTGWGEPALTLEPEADLCFAGLPWGCTLEDAQAVLPGAVRDGLTLTLTGASVCGFRADAVLTFKEDEQGTFLNTVALTFTEEPEQMTLERFERTVLCEELSETWGQRHIFLPDPDESRTHIDDFGHPERLWYWYTEDFSDDYRWMSGVTAWFERTGDPRVLYLDASGRNLAAGRQFELPRNAVTNTEAGNQLEWVGKQMTAEWTKKAVGGTMKTGKYDYLEITVRTEEDFRLMSERLAAIPWYHVILDPSAPATDPPPEPSPLPHYPVEEGWTLLSDEEIEAAREALIPTRFNDDGSIWVNPVDPCFTSCYQDPRELNFSAFMRYFGLDDPGVTAATEEDFRALREAGHFGGSPWLHVEDISTPLRRIPASMVEEALRRYFDIGLDDLKVDYRTRNNYLARTDSFYSMTSDFGPGTFQPEWGERQGDTVRLWNSQTCLTCRKLEDRWIILSFWNETVGGQQAPEDPETRPPAQRWRYGVAPEYQWVFITQELNYKSMTEGDDTVLTIPAGYRYRVEWVQITPEGEIWLRSELETMVDPAIQAVMLRPEDVIPWTEELADQTVCPVYIPAGVAYYPRTFGYGDEAKASLAECLTEDNAQTHGYDMAGVIQRVEDGYALMGFAGGMEVWVKHEEVKVGTPSGDETVNEHSRMLAEGRVKAEELGYPLETWGAELIWHRGKSEDGSSAYYAAYYPVSTGEGTVCVVFAGSYESGWTPDRTLLIPPGAEDWP